MIEALHGILPNEDRDAAQVVQQQIVKDGVTLLCCGQDLQVVKTADRQTTDRASHGRPYDITVDEILVGVGRTPNVEGLGLEQAGVEFNAGGVKVNGRLQTSNPEDFRRGRYLLPLQVYPCCRRNGADRGAERPVSPSVRAGLCKRGLADHPLVHLYGAGNCAYRDVRTRCQAKGIEVETYTFNLDEVDRAILDGEENGFARIHLRKGTDKILGATIVAAHAGDLIDEFSVVMKAGKGARTIAGTIHPYPTQAEVNKKVVNLWRKAHFSPATKNKLVRLFAWMRRG